MKQYRSMLRMRFIAGLQYRSAAIAGVVTQYVWGFMEILMFKAFYDADPAAFPMSLDALVSYIWLQQAFLTLFTIWLFDNDILRSITDGSVAYELCRPIQIYPMWFSKSLANRLARMILRSLPILVTAFFMPAPFRLQPPTSIWVGLWFFISLVISTILVVALGMFIYIITFYTLSSIGVRVVIIGIVEFLSGAIVPLPFFPEKIRRVVELLPFASMQNVPLRIYSGDIEGIEIVTRIALQLFWLLTCYLMGNYIMHKTLRHVVVQGG